MVIISSLNILNNFKLNFLQKIRKLYLNSKFYNNKISKVKNKHLIYKPSPSLIDCLVKYKKEKYKIEDFQHKNIWINAYISEKNFKKLNSFFWLFTLDLKSSNKITQDVIEKWIDDNTNYNIKSWELDILSKRVIAWLSNARLTYENGSEDYKEKFNFLVRKQVNHLVNEIYRSKYVDDKLIGCTAIILCGLCYRDTKFLSYGISLLKKIIEYSLDDLNFPKSRSFRQLIFYLKNFVLIRELLKDSQSEIPDFINETIFYLGQSYNFFWQRTKESFLFNGNIEIDNTEFDKYLNSHGYKFKCQTNDMGNYGFISNKKNSLIVDLGNSPDKKFSSNYQAGALSFEFSHMSEKIVCNSGYYQNVKHQLNVISKSSAAHSTLIIDNSSIVNFQKGKFGKKYVEKNFKVFERKILNEKNKWFFTASHDGYLKKFGIIHKRNLTFYPEKQILQGSEYLFFRKPSKNKIFEIRFHLHPSVKATKTIEGKYVLIEAENSGWKFISDNTIDIETGLYFGKKNRFVENQNIFVSGKLQSSEQIIKWSIEKI